MTDNPRYVIDTCSMTALRRIYPSDVFPSVWNKVSELAESGLLISVEDVYEELRVFDDEILDWANQHSDVFVELDSNVQTKASEILASHTSILDVKKRKSSADPFVIALAMTRSCAVITEEKPSNNHQKVKIPDVCKAYGVPCMTLLEMLKAEKLRV